MKNARLRSESGAADTAEHASKAVTTKEAK
jgi:hypothetical protein